MIQKYQEARDLTERMKMYLRDNYTARELDRLMEMRQKEQCDSLRDVLKENLLDDTDVEALAFVISDLDTLALMNMTGEVLGSEEIYNHFMNGEWKKLEFAIMEKLLPLAIEIAFWDSADELFSISEE